MNNDGLQKSAILLMSLGEDDAAEVFKYLEPREVQKIGTAMAAMRSVTRDDIANVLGEFCSEAGEQTTIGMSSDDYLKSVLKKALGDDRSANLLDRILNGDDTSGIEGLKAAGCEVITYAGDEISHNRTGGPTCLTRPLLRDAVARDV